jgi:hypothetical protein
MVTRVAFVAMCTTCTAIPSGRTITKTGAWVMNDEYIEPMVRKMTKQSTSAGHACTENVKAWCVYRLDTDLVKEMVNLIGASSVTELGAGFGRYARAVLASGRTQSYTAYDGMPGIEEMSHGWVRYGDLTNASLLLKRSDYVVTLETAEHIPRRFERTFLDHIDATAAQGVILSWSTSRRGVGHVNIKSVKAVQQLFCQRGFHLDSVSTRKLRQAAYYWYFRRNILVLKRQPPSRWVSSRVSASMAEQGTNMMTCGSTYSCCIVNNSILVES